MAGARSGPSALLRVDHPDPLVRRRGRNALVIVYGLAVVSVPAIVALTFLHNGQVIALAALAVTLVMLVCAGLIRSGHVDLGTALFFLAYFVAMIAPTLISGEGRLTAIYCAIPVGIAGVTVDRRGLAFVTAAALTIGAWSTYGYPNDAAILPTELMIAAAFLVVIFVLVTVLGLTAQRAETSRADALSASLRASNDELERRVAERTTQLQQALDRQEQLVAELAELSLRDPLTGLHNRRHADAELPRLAAAADRHDQPLAMAMADLDRFKNVNDDHSYQVGDAVLRQFADIVLSSVRGSDVVTRYGGEEFLVLMPHTTIEQALVLCERIREAVEEHDWSAIQPGLAVTVSIGVSDSITSGGLVTLGADTDAALHRAKREGRNRVVAAVPGAGPPLMR